MFGLNVVKQKDRKSNYYVRAQEVPGFSKWIANEVYVENKLVESTLEQLALSMMENVEWINETMNDVLAMDDSMENDVEGKEKIDTPALRDVDQNHETTSIDKTNIIEDKEESNDSKIETTTLLLKSPSRIRKHSSASLNKIKARELDLVTTTTNLVLNSAELKSNKINTADDALVGNVDEEAQRDLNDSFEAISRHIRKSFVNMVNQRNINSESPNNMSNTLTRETEPTDPNVFVESPAKSSDPIQLYKKSSPEMEVEEISKLIENKQDESDLSTFEDDLSIDIGPLEKIDYSEIQAKKIDTVPVNNINDITKSPIKFHEIPTREPIILDSTRKSIRMSVTSATTRATNSSSIKPTMNVLETPKNSVRIKTPKTKEDESVFIDKTGAKLDKHNFKLDLPPGRFVSNSHLSPEDEPTIKVNRTRRNKVDIDNKNDATKHKSTPINNTPKLQYIRSAPHVNLPVLKSPQSMRSPSSREDLISRLMKPTESSLKRQRESPHKLQATIDLKQSELEDSPTTILVPLKDVSPVFKPSARARSLGFGMGSSSENKKGIPLTMKSLKINETKVSIINKSQTSMTSGIPSPPRRLLMHSMNKIGGTGTVTKKPRTEKYIAFNNGNHERKKLRSITDMVENNNNNMLIDKPVNDDVRKKIITINKPEDLPEIDSGVEDEEAVKLADWGSSERLRRQLRSQAKTNPVEVFGGLDTVDCSSIFGKRYSDLMNIRWQQGDYLSSRELASYERAMGWRV